MHKYRNIPIITLLSMLLIFICIPYEINANSSLIDETFDSAIPADWTQVKYSGEGIWESENYGTAESHINISADLSSGSFAIK